MSSPDDNTSPHARANYDNHVARRRQLSSGPLGGDVFQNTVAFFASKRYACVHFFGVQRANLPFSYYITLNELPFYFVLF